MNMKHSIDTLRFLGVDMINKANSGHPGIVLGAAPVVYSLFTDHIKVTSDHPDWFDRDRFVLSAGHGSALLYATLHLAGYDVTMDDIKQFRQLDSKTPGHPEYGLTEGVEATTGPLGQGIGMAVGMAIAEKHLAARFNKNRHDVIDHYTYVLCGDGDLQEGITMEALSLAGHLKLDKLIIMFDSNDVQLDGPVDDAYSDDIKQKIIAMNFDYQKVDDANDTDGVSKAITKAKETNKPSFIEIKSVIGYGAKAEGTAATHGKPIGEEETEKMRKDFGFEEKPFEVADEVYEDFKTNVVDRGNAAYETWAQTLKKYKEDYPKDYQALKTIIDGGLDVDLTEMFGEQAIGTAEATRDSIKRFLPELSEAIPHMMGGSADLSGSTRVKGNNGDFTADHPEGRNINFGVREHAMAGIVNGMTLHNMKAFSGGFFIFSDYMKPAMRIAALMSIPSIYIFTHDSIAVGEDGPTHEPVEQLAIFRSMPNCVVLRPAHADEVRHAICYALKATERPTLIVLTRQKTTVLNNVDYASFEQGAYVASDAGNADGTLIASGSELELAIKAKERLAGEGVNVRVVSMPSMELFLELSEEKQNDILPDDGKKRLAIEAGATGLWYRFADDVIGLDRFGKSGKGDEVAADLGFNVENVTKRFMDLLK